MRKRDFILVVGGLAATWPLLARAQNPPRRWRVALLNYSAPEANRIHLWDVFRQRMRELGYVEGNNIAFDLRWADGRVDALPGLASEVVKLQVDIIVIAGTPVALAAKQATNTIPIVMATGSDPVSSGLVASLARPGGNVTGVVTLDSELPPKRLALLREMMPRASRVASLIDPNTSGSTRADQATKQAAQALGISVQTVSARGPAEFESAFTSILRPRIDAILIQPSAMFAGERSRLAELALKHGIPTVTTEKAYAEAGCLMSYGTEFAENFRRVAAYVDKILKGAKPGDLPIEQPTKFELVINIKTAKTLGLTIPQHATEIRLHYQSRRFGSSDG